MTIGVGTLSIYIHLDKKILEATEHGAQHHYRIILSTMSTTTFIKKPFDRQTFVETDITNHADQ